MTNLEVLEKLSKGTDKLEEVEIEFEGQKETFTIRPLNAGELSQLQAMEKKGFTMKVGVNPKGQRQTVQTNTDVDVNAGEFNENQTEAMYNGIAWSLSVNGENVTAEQVKRLPTGVPEDLFEEVIRISNLSDSDLTIIKTFRKEE